MSFQRVEYPTGNINDGNKLRYTRMTRTVGAAAGAVLFLLDESLAALVLPEGATIERVRILPNQFAERLPYPTTIGGNPTIEVTRVSTDGTIVKRIRSYATDEIGDTEAAPFSQGLITVGLAVDAKTIDTGVFINVLVGTKANPSAGVAEGAGAALRPIGAAPLVQYNDEGAFAKVRSHLKCTFASVVDVIKDVTVVVEYHISRRDFTVPDPLFSDPM
jgi:hypothetical protein